jgi:hypothetical protein
MREMSAPKGVKGPQMINALFQGATPARLISDAGWAVTVAATVGAPTVKSEALAMASVPAAPQQRT